MAKRQPKEKPFRKSDLGYYDDEEGYQALKEAYDEKHGGK